MTAESWHRVQDLFKRALSYQPGDRGPFLAAACGDDHDLRAEVENLLERHDAANQSSLDMYGAGDPTVERTVPTGPEERRATADRAIGPYEIVHEIGRGGMGVVYVAVRREDRFKQHVAVKVVMKGKDTEEVLKRFRQERQVLSALNHPGIARLSDAGETGDGRPYFVMEYVDGAGIAEYCDLHRLHIDERLELFRKVCDAVHYAHQNLVVHRDLKPGNILVTESGQPKLLDFGIAKLLNPQISLITGAPTDPALRLMTPEYASPEQVRGASISTASDVYSLGVLLYELVSGHPPYHLRTRLEEEVVRIICEEDPEKPSTVVTRAEEIERQGKDGGRSTTTITPELVGKARESRPERLRRQLAGDVDNIVLKAMRKEPQRRYASAEQMSEDIRRHLAGLPIIARPDTLSYRVSKFVKRNRIFVAAAAVVLVGLVVGIIGLSYGLQVARAERDRAENLFAAGRILAKSFIFDFSEELEQVDGAFPAQEMLVGNALEYLDSVSSVAGEDLEFQRELAAAFERVGDVQGGLRNPSRGETSTALKSYETATAIRRRIADAQPTNDAVQGELMLSLIDLADMHRRRNEFEDAERYYTEALDIQERIANPSPSDLLHLATVLAGVGVTHKKGGNLEEARKPLERSLQIRRDLRDRLDSETPPEMRNRILRALSVGCIDLGDLEAKERSFTVALDLFDEAVRIRKEAFDQDRESTGTRRDLVMAYGYWADAALLAGERRKEALDRLESAWALSVKLVRDNPGDNRQELTLVWITGVYAYALATGPDPSQAVPILEETLELVGENSASAGLRQLLSELRPD